MWVSPLMLGMCLNVTRITLARRVMHWCCCMSGWCSSFLGRPRDIRMQNLLPWTQQYYLWAPTGSGFAGPSLFVLHSIGMRNRGLFNVRNTDKISLWNIIRSHGVVRRTQRLCTAHQSILVFPLLLPLSFLHPSIQKFPLGHEGSEGAWMPLQEGKLEEGLGDLVNQRGGEGNDHWKIRF